MTTLELQTAIHAQPFRPFALRIADGRSLHVPHPDFIAHAPGARIALVTSRAGSDIVDLLLVTTLEFLEPPVSRPRRRRT